MTAGALLALLAYTSMVGTTLAQESRQQDPSAPGLGALLQDGEVIIGTAGSAILSEEADERQDLSVVDFNDLEDLSSVDFSDHQPAYGLRPREGGEVLFRSPEMALRSDIPPLIDEEVYDVDDQEAGDREVDSPCDQTFALSSFYLFSLVEQNCTFTVVKSAPSVCQLSLHVNRLGRDDCFVVGGNGSLCGREAANDTGLLVPFEEEELAVGVNVPPRLSEADERDPFNVTIRQVVCDGRRVWNENEKPETDGPVAMKQTSNCGNGKTIRKREFLLQSPGYPFPYPSDVDCSTVVVSVNSNICSLEMRFDEFSVEPSGVLDECANDFLLIEDPLAPSTKYCGSFTGIRLIEMTTVKKFTFHSNPNVTYGGYSIFVKQIPCDEVLPRTTTASTTTTTVTTTSTTSTTITTTSLTTRRNPFRTTPTPTSTISTTTIRNPFTTTTTVTVSTTFRNPFTTTTFRNPFNTNRPTVGPPVAEPRFCLRIIDDASSAVRLRSPGYPAFYAPDTFCRYIVRLTNPNVCFLRVDFIDFDVEFSRDCEKDYLQVLDDRLCGSRSGSAALHVIPDGERSVEIVFSADGVGSGRGFLIDVTELPCPTLPATESTTTTTPELPVYSRPTPPFFTPRPPFLTTFGPPLSTGRPPFVPTRRPTTSRPRFPTRPPPVHSTFGPPLPSSAPPSTSRPQYPTTERPHSTSRPLFTTHPQYSTTFHPIVTTPRPYKPSYSPHPPRRPTYHHHRPRPYHPHQGHRHQPHKPSSSRRPRLIDQIFDAKRRFLESILSIFTPKKSSKHHHHHHPRNGFIGDDRESSHLELRQQEGLVEHNEDLTFKPSPWDEASASQSSTKLVLCGSSTDANAFTFVSPRYPDDYPDGADCTWRVAAAQDVCALQLKLDDFIVEESTACVNDRLDLGSGLRLCGQRSGQTLSLPLALGDDGWTFKFRSDGRGTCRGFKIDVKQIPCHSLGKFRVTSSQ